MKSIEGTEFPKILSDIAILQAKHDALEGAFFEFVKYLKPDELNHWHNAYEKTWQKSALLKINEIPMVDEALQDFLKRQLEL
jgi:hypothetical protein